ncbi:MAG: hypothetical protein WD851_06790 [Pirellulales bacterium]
MLSLDDIKFWVGTGDNRAALVIDWVEGTAEPAALAWGYRWDGAATGRDMLMAVVEADHRLFAKLGGTLTNPAAVYGLGYDASDDGEFGLDDDTQFNAAGIAITSSSDLAIAVNTNDYYAEGWFTGLWHYSVATDNPYDGGAWQSASTGMAGRVLADGTWDSWAFSPTFDFTAFATNPVAAAPPIPLPGDYNGDDVVDLLDYQTWASAFGNAWMNPADGNGDGGVNAADYAVWRDRLDASANLTATTSHAVPEPATVWLALALFAYRFTLIRCRSVLF